MRFRFRGSYSCGEQFECKDPVSASQRSRSQHVVPPFEFKVAGRTRTPCWTKSVSGLRAKFHWGRIPERELCAHFRVSRTPLRRGGVEGGAKPPPAARPSPRRGPAGAFLGAIKIERWSPKAQTNPRCPWPIC